MLYLPCFIWCYVLFQKLQKCRFFVYDFKIVFGICCEAAKDLLGIATTTMPFVVLCLCVVVVVIIRSILNHLLTDSRTISIAIVHSVMIQTFEGLRHLGFVHGLPILLCLPVGFPIPERNRDLPFLFFRIRKGSPTSEGIVPR